MKKQSIQNSGDSRLWGHKYPRKDSNLLGRRLAYVEEEGLQEAEVLVLCPLLTSSVFQISP